MPHRPPEARSEVTVWTSVDVGGLLVLRGAGEDELNHWDFEGTRLRIPYPPPYTKSSAYLASILNGCAGVAFGCSSRSHGRALRAQVPIQADHGRFVPLGLAVSIGSCRLLNACVAHLGLNPPQVCAVLQQPGRVRVSGGVVLPIGKAGLGQEWLPDRLDEVPMSGDPTIQGGEHELALLDVPLLDLTLQVHRINL